MVDVHLDLRDPASHRVGVSLRLKPRLSRMRLQFPGWTPGSYLIRDYVRQLEGLEVRQGEQRLEARRLSPACWQICPDPAGLELEIRYWVMAIELTVRTPHLDADHGFLPLAGVVLELEGERWSSHRLHCSLISGWQAFSSLRGDPNGSLPGISINCWTVHWRLGLTPTGRSAWPACPIGWSAGAESLVAGCGCWNAFRICSRIWSGSAWLVAA